MNKKKSEFWYMLHYIMFKNDIFTALLLVPYWYLVMILKLMGKDEMSMVNKKSKRRIISNCENCGMSITLEEYEGEFKGFEAKELSICISCGSKTIIKFEGYIDVL